MLSEQEVQELHDRVQSLSLRKVAATCLALFTENKRLKAAWSRETLRAEGLRAELEKDRKVLASLTVLIRKADGTPHTPEELMELLKGIEGDVE